MMPRLSRRAAHLMLAAILLLLGTLIVSAAPQVPSSISPSASRRDNFPASQSVVAYAGNISELSLTQEQLSKGWQGYYGTISGDIVLDDAMNQTLFAWPLLPQGNIYATWNATTPDWNNLSCLNPANATIEAARFNIDEPNNDDNFTNTFNVSNSHPTFNVSNENIAANECKYSAWMYVNDAYPTSSPFNETVLFDNTYNFTVYTAIVNDNQVGFNGSTWDFQMVVPEDGWNDNTDELTYYFYVELI